MGNLIKLLKGKKGVSEEGDGSKLEVTDGKNWGEDGREVNVSE